MRSSPLLFTFCLLPLAVTFYQLLPARNTLRNSFLTCCGLAIYLWWNPLFLLLLLGTTALDYHLGGMIFRAGANAPRKRFGVAFSMGLNAALLAFFKFSGFGAGSASAIIHWSAWAQVPSPEFFRSIVLPVGLSFHIFQSAGYCIDLYRGRSRPAESYLEFICFVSLFPHLVAGPVMHHCDLSGQIRSRVNTIQDFALGLTRASLGFSKAVLVAAPMGGIADRVFDAGEGLLTTASAWIGLFAYAFQIYFNFSACSDIAIGLARTAGFHLAENFDSPYKSVSITDFWRRWHITLSVWLRDRLYVPLGGNRHGTARTCLNLMLCMLVAALWHGAQWTFLVWGAIHGGMLALERSLGKNRPYAGVPAGLRVAFIFSVVLIAWVFFRAESIGAAMRHLAIMFGGGTVLPPALLLQAELGSGFNVLLLVATALVVWFAPNTQTVLRRFTWWKALLALVLFAAASLAMLADGHGAPPP